MCVETLEDTYERLFILKNIYRKQLIDFVFKQLWVAFEKFQGIFRDYYYL